MPAPRTSGVDAPPALITGSFVTLCCAMLFGYANQWVIMPAIPLYVDSLGGSAFVAGLALLAFSVPSFTVRPFVGMLADRWSAVGVLAVGLVLLTLGSLLFLLPLLAMVFIGGIVRGLGWAGVNTGGYTTLATTAPAQRRGEAAGYYSSVTSGATVLFPALGLWLIEAGHGFIAVFVASALFSFMGLPFALMLRQGKPAPVEKRGDAEGGILDRGVLLSTGLNLCATLPMASVMAFLPLYARSLGIDHIGLYYVIAGITNILVRPLLGKWSDAMGRGPAVGVGLCAQLLGFSLIFIAHSLPLILVGGAFVALGSAMVGSTTTALAMDLANPRSRGQAMATYSISYQMGAGVGAIISGALADLIGLRGMYAGSITITLIGLGMLASAWKLIPKPQR